MDRPKNSQEFSRFAPGRPAPGRRASAISILAFVYSMFAIAGAGADTVFYGFLFLLAGLPIYVWLKRAIA